MNKYIELDQTWENYLNVNFKFFILLFSAILLIPAFPFLIEKLGLLKDFGYFIILAGLILLILLGLMTLIVIIIGVIYIIKLQKLISIIFKNTGLNNQLIIQKTISLLIYMNMVLIALPLCIASIITIKIIGIIYGILSLLSLIYPVYYLSKYIKSYWSIRNITYDWKGVRN